MMYKVVRFSTLRSSRESERLYAKINFRLLGKDLRNFKFRKVKDFLVKPIKDDINVVKSVGSDVNKATKEVVSGPEKKIKNLRDLKAGIIRGARRVRDWVNGKDGEVVVDNIGTNADRVKTLYGRALGYANPLALKQRYILQLAKDLKVKDVAGATNPFALIKKRLRQVGSIFKPKGELRQKFTEEANKFVTNPGGSVSQKLHDYISTGGGQLMDDMVQLDKVRVHVNGMTDPVSFVSAGLGFYPGDVARTTVRTATAAADKLANRYIMADNGKPIRLAARYRLASRGLGKFYNRYVKEPVAKLINTGTAATAAMAGHPEVANTLMMTGAPVITGNTARSIINRGVQGVKKMFIPKA